MDLQTFNSLKSQLKDEPFFSDKKSTLESFLQNYWFSGEQAAKVIGNFPHASEKTEVLALIEPRLTVLTGVGARKVVAAFTFADGKLKAVGLVANHINDPVGKYDVLEAIDFAFDKEKARKILDKARPPSVAQCPAGQPQPYSHPQPPHAHPYQPPAQSAPYGAPYSQPPPQQPYQPPPQQAQPYQPPPQCTPYSQAPGFGFVERSLEVSIARSMGLGLGLGLVANNLEYLSQASYRAPPQPTTAPYAPPYGRSPVGGNPYYATQGVPSPNAAYAPQGGACPPPGGPPTGYPNTYGFPRPQ